MLTVPRKIEIDSSESRESLARDAARYRKFRLLAAAGFFEATVAMEQWDYYGSIEEFDKAVDEFET